MFTHDKGRLQGAITFKQSGAAVTGTWHTEIGKVEPDSPVAGQIDVYTLYLTRSMGDLAAILRPHHLARWRAHRRLRRRLGNRACQFEPQPGRRRALPGAAKVIGLGSAGGLAAGAV